MISSKRGFTLVELLVVVGMIAVVLGALSTSVSSAQQRARIQKATSDVKVISQAILAYENYDANGSKDFSLSSVVGTDREADAGYLSFLIGNGGRGASGKIPALLMAQLQSGGKLRDPWGTPYKITVKEKASSISFRVASGSMRTGFDLPNFYRLGKDERTLNKGDDE